MPRLDFYIDSRLFLKVKLDSDTTLLGRGSDCQIQLPRTRVSRQHAAIRYNGENFEIENLSTNGTRLNAAMVEGPTPLTAGARLYIADYTIIYQPDDVPSEDLEEDRTLLG